jgi:hypothetical protein
MTPQVVSKLFNEVKNGSQSELVKRIQEKRMQNSTIDKSLELSARMSSKASDIYINYKKDGKPIKHYSIHLCPETINKQNGPTHMIMNTYNGRQGIPMHVYRDETAPSKIRIEVGIPFGKKVTAIDQQEAQYVAESLNDFFNEAAQNSSEQPLHKNAQKVYTNIQTSLKRHNKIKRRKTRRRR